MHSFGLCFHIIWVRSFRLCFRIMKYSGKEVSILDLHFLMPMRR
ncbi:hypothetical protein GCWU000341_00524 [Oribacterium sp. oral taxon 078 str. F0262]|nr:hypothetical protein GCWU000341_00524 [Oribacterium sp. oral taxon 078 str. F0262]